MFDFLKSIFKLIGFSSKTKFEILCLHGHFDKVVKIITDHSSLIKVLLQNGLLKKTKNK